MEGLLLTYYGDDFTGSTDVMEAMSTHGVDTVLFTRVPHDDERARFPEAQAIGIAGTSRSQTPDWMDQHLPPVFAWLKGQGARFCLYKVCSTFDSAPKVGNIGRAIEIGRRVFGQGLTPLIVGAPQLKRYTSFGHLFAGYQGQTYRIDRHPVMSRHPVTPMDEADLRLHLARQTDVPVTLVPLTALYTDDPASVDAALEGFSGIALIDVADPVSQINAGRQLLRLSHRTGPFVAGSSGVNYALVKALAADGAIPGTAQFQPLSAVDRIIAVSGSCSPTTARQIRHALANGFTGLHADPLRLSDEVEVQRLASESIRLLKDGKSVLVYTALDPESDRGPALDKIPAPATASARRWAASPATPSRKRASPAPSSPVATPRATPSDNWTSSP